ncbi:GMC family oxidoreductase N-terminal domain-containing protein [Desulfobulbus elongatus]|uniref:GMC family oxidoreductase N-terminal domain-containing protein n=1 Tax=Desulfobulbus elongatus TaxID=53332 RepID=UPI0004852AF1|nr:GMC family oxidoreductase N-terminal domain-containing protein [Desulfobulbus elongatus]
MQKQDIIVVGSGAGGATVAKEMAERGYRVSIVEWGRDNPPKGGPFAHPLRFFGGRKKRAHAFLKTEGEPQIEIVRAITTGGSTLVYGGVSWDPPLKLFEKYGVDIKNELDSVKNEIIIRPLAPSEMGAAGKRIRDAAIRVGLNWQNIDRFFLDPEKFRQSSYLFGDRTGARWDARVWIKRAINRGAVVYNEHYCEKLIIKSGKVIGIQTITAQGTKKEFFADVVVVAAGGIGSPVILNHSGVKAGEGIFVDPYVVAVGYLDRAVTGAEVTRQAGILLHDDGVAFGDASLPPQAYMKLIVSNKKINKMFSRNKCLSLLVEIDDDISGGIDSAGKIKKTLSVNDLAKLDKGKEIATSILEAAGAKDIWFSKIAGVHPGGACKIGTVVDANLSTCIENLYVCDASVLPESMAIPPVMSILCLGKRLARHLSSQ